MKKILASIIKLNSVMIKSDLSFKIFLNLFIIIWLFPVPIIYQLCCEDLSDKLTDFFNVQCVIAFCRTLIKLFLIDRLFLTFADIQSSRLPKTILSSSRQNQLNLTLLTSLQDILVPSVCNVLKLLNRATHLVLISLQQTNLSLRILTQTYAAYCEMVF